MLKEQAAPSNYAFVFYRPATQAVPEQVFYNDEAYAVLSLCAASQNVCDDIPLYIVSLCLKWQEIYDGDDAGPADGSGMRLVVALQSHQRKYCVKGIALSEFPASAEKKQYLFVVERAAPESANFSMIFRRYKLSGREQEMARLLLAGDSNKEIACKLGLSENTIKGYMKLLMRKLGVFNRAGIVAALLSGKPKDL